MSAISYLHHFQQAAALLDKKRFDERQLLVETGIWIDCPVLKLRKTNWFSAPSAASPTAAIFFSVWTADAPIKKQQLLYNIHAFKLRHLKGHRITSKEFAAAFRKQFKKHEHHWPNVSTQFGPLTLMQGWQPINPDNFRDDIVRLSNQFLELVPLIDQLLEDRKHIPSNRHK